MELDRHSRFRRAYVSFNRREWWYGHLMTALARRIDVIDCPMQCSSQTGHPLDADVTRFVDADGDDAAFYLGSVDQLFQRIADVPVPSAVWTDWIMSSSANIKQLPCLSLFDVVFSTQKDAVPALQHAGNRYVEWLPFACDTTLTNNPAAPKVYDVGFVGNLDLPATRDERRELLGDLDRRYRMNDYRVPAFGSDMMKVYNQSRIVVNVPVPGGFNMRVFEALASGALLLTKRVGNGQEDLFRDGVHLITYRDRNDLIEKTDYYLRHDREREEIAAEGRREVCARHTYDHRAARVLDVMSGAAPLRARNRPAQIAAYAAFWDAAGRPDLLGALALEPDVPIAMRVRLLLRAGAKLYRQAATRRAAVC